MVIPNREQSFSSWSLWYWWWCTDGTELDHPTQVETIQRRLLEALCHLLSRHHHRDTPVSVMIGRTISALTELRSASAALDRFTANTPLNAFQLLL